MLPLSFYYHTRRQLGHYQSQFELGYVMRLEQTWSAFGQGLISNNVVFSIFQLCELPHEKKMKFYFFSDRLWNCNFTSSCSSFFKTQRSIHPSSISGFRSIKTCVTGIATD